MQKMGNYAKGNFEELGMIGPMKEYSKLAISGQHEIKEYSIVRDSQGNQFISQDDLDTIKQEITSYEYDNEQM